MKKESSVKSKTLETDISKYFTQYLTSKHLEFEFPGLGENFIHNLFLFVKENFFKRF